MSDEAKVRELFAPAQSRPVDVEARRFKVDREKIVSAILAAPRGSEAERAAPPRWRTIAAMAAGLVALVGSAGGFALRRSPGTGAADRSLSVAGVHGTVTRIEHGVGHSFAPGQAVTISLDGEFLTAPQSPANLRAATAF